MTKRLPQLRKSGDCSPLTQTVLIAALALLLGVGTVSAQGKRTLAGRVVDQSGTGVTGVRVWVLRGNPVAAEAVADCLTDSHGRFSIGPLSVSSQPEQTPGWGVTQVREFDVLARAQDGRFAWLGQSNIQESDPRDLELQLVECTDAHGRFVDQTGKPIRDALIVPASFLRELKREGKNVRVALPPLIAGQLGARTTADGSFAIKGLPRNCEISARITAQGFGSLDLYWSTANRITATLDSRLGRITGRFKLPDQRRLDRSVTISIGAFPPENQWEEQKYSIVGRKDVVADPSGQFKFEGLQPGRYFMTPEVRSDAPFVLAWGGNNTFIVGPGSTVNVPDIPLEPAVTVTGRVIDEETEKGIPGVSVYSHVHRFVSGSWRIVPTLTDQEGRYRLKTGKGQVQISVIKAPDAYLRSNDRRQSTLETSGDRTWPDIKLSRATTLEGIVIDGTGRAVVGAEVFGSESRTPIKSGPDGTFRIRQLAPNALLAIGARSESTGAVSDGAILVKMKEQKGTLKVEIDPRFAFRIRGTIADLAGKPIEGAEISLHCMWKMPSEDPRSGSWSGRTWAAYSTDHSGRFQSDALFPGHPYTLNVTAKGFAPYQTA